jgi:hypothetical protein
MPSSHLSRREQVRGKSSHYLSHILWSSIVSHYTSSLSSSSIDTQTHFSSLFQSYWKSYQLPPDDQDETESSLQGRDNIVKAVCPNLHGMFYVKLSLLLTLIGGSRSTADHHGSRRRSQSHLLIVGDPGISSKLWTLKSDSGARDREESALEICFNSPPMFSFNNWSWNDWIWVDLCSSS